MDYSKWDKMANEMSDSDDDNNGPEVTTFDEPQSVTFGGTPASKTTEGWGDTSQTNSAPPPPAINGLAVDGKNATVDPASVSGCETSGAGNSTAPRPIPAPTIIDDAGLTENGAAVHLEPNGRLSHVWRQTKTEATFVVPVPPGTRAGDIGVSLRAKSDTIAEGVADLVKVSIKAKGGSEGQQEAVVEVLLEGELAFQAKLDGEGDVDWELKDFPGTMVARIDADETIASTASVEGAEGKERPLGSIKQDAGIANASNSNCSNNNSSTAKPDRRAVEVTLRKHCPIPGATVWWKSLLKGDPEIDVASIRGRASNSHQSVWEEALGMFKERVAAKKSQAKISVDMGDD